MPKARFLLIFWLFWSLATEYSCSQPVSFSDFVAPTGVRIVQDSSFIYVTPIDAHSKRDSIVLSHTYEIASYQFDDNIGRAKILYIQGTSEYKGTSTVDRMEYATGIKPGHSFVILRDSTTINKLFLQDGESIEADERKYVTTEFNKYLWCEAVWRIFHGRSYLINDTSLIPASIIEKALLRSKVDTLTNPAILQLINIDTTSGIHLAEFELIAITGSNSRVVVSTAKHRYNIKVTYPDCKLTYIKETYQEENYYPIINDTVIVEGERIVRLDWIGG